MPEERTAADAEETKPFVIFRLGAEEFGMDVMNIKEIARITTITRVPHTPDFIEGVINFRGNLSAVINLRKRFGFESKEIDADSRIIIAECEGKPVGMLVDAAEAFRIPVSDIEASPEMATTEISKEYLLGVGKVENRQFILLDLEQVLAKTELEGQKEFEAREEKREVEKEKNTRNINKS